MEVVGQETENGCGLELTVPWRTVSCSSVFEIQVGEACDEGAIREAKESSTTITIPYSDTTLFVRVRAMDEEGNLGHGQFALSLSHHWDPQGRQGNR